MTEVEEQTDDNTSSVWIIVVQSILIAGVMATAVISASYINPSRILNVQIVFFATPFILWGITRFNIPMRKWVVFNIAGLSMGVVAATYIGMMLDIWMVLIAFIFLLIYDIVAVHKTDVMESLGNGAFALNLPMLIVIPHSLSFSLDDLREEISELGLSKEASKESTRCSIIGVGDLAVPGVLAVSALEVSASWATLYGNGIPLGSIGAIIGAVIGMVALQLYLNNGMVAGMITLVPSTITGYFVGSLIAGATVTAIVGF